MNEKQEINLKLTKCKRQLNAIDHFTTIHKNYVERKLFLDKSSRINRPISKKYLDGLLGLNKYKRTKEKLEKMIKELES